MSFMKFIKANLVLVICGAAALLAIIAVAPIPYLPIYMLDASLQEKVKGEFEHAQLVKTLENTSLEVPATTETFKGPPEPEIINAKKQAIEDMKAQAAAVATAGANA